jgi:hypothetical protein
VVTLLNDPPPLLPIGADRSLYSIVLLILYHMSTSKAYLLHSENGSCIFLRNVGILFVYHYTTSQARRPQL